MEYYHVCMAYKYNIYIFNQMKNNLGMTGIKSNDTRNIIMFLVSLLFMIGGILVNNDYITWDVGMM